MKIRFELKNDPTPAALMAIVSVGDEDELVEFEAKGIWSEGSINLVLDAMADDVGMNGPPEVIVCGQSQDVEETTPASDDPPAAEGR